jgi:hypothetical protein
VSALKERVDETRVQVGRQIGQTSREGDQRVKNLETRLAKLDDDLKARRGAESVRRQSQPRDFRGPTENGAERWPCRGSGGGV